MLCIHAVHTCYAWMATLDGDGDGDGDGWIHAMDDDGWMAMETEMAMEMEMAMDDRHGCYG